MDFVFKYVYNTLISRHGRPGIYPTNALLSHFMLSLSIKHLRGRRGALCIPKVMVIDSLNDLLQPARCWECLLELQVPPGAGEYPPEKHSCFTALP